MTQEKDKTLCAVLATHNAHKIRELTALFAKNGIDIALVSLDEVGFSGEITEDGKSFEDNALIKARAAASVCNMTAIADDSGLEVDALGGAPGVYSARYAGTGIDVDNNAKLLKALDGVPEEKRTARFVCVMAIVFPDGRELTVRGEVHGYIASQPSGSGRFGYDPLFYYPPLGATFASLEPEVKNSVSHRANAVTALAKILLAKSLPAKTNDR